MAKILIEVDEQDGRILIGCIGFTVSTIQDPASLIQSMLDPVASDRMRAILGLIAGTQRPEQIVEKIQTNDGLDEIVTAAISKMDQLRGLMKLIAKQTDPDKNYDFVSVHRG